MPAAAACRRSTQRQHASWQQRPGVFADDFRLTEALCGEDSLRGLGFRIGDVGADKNQMPESTWFHSAERRQPGAAQLLGYSRGAIGFAERSDLNREAVGERQ